MEKVSIDVFLFAKLKPGIYFCSQFWKPQINLNLKDILDKLAKKESSLNSHMVRKSKGFLYNIHNSKCHKIFKREIRRYKWSGCEGVYATKSQNSKSKQTKCRTFCLLLEKQCMNPKIQKLCMRVWFELWCPGYLHPSTIKCSSLELDFEDF